MTQAVNVASLGVAMTADSSGNLLFNSGYGSAATAYGCRAWVNFNGTGTVAIRGSGNVSSITDNGVGDYTVNFSVAMPNVDYAVCATPEYSNTRGDTVGAHNAWIAGYAASTSSANLQVTGSTSYFDAQTVSVSIFR